MRGGRSLKVGNNPLLVSCFWDFSLALPSKVEITRIYGERSDDDGK
jgi:hypothetical protein